MLAPIFTARAATFGAGVYENISTPTAAIQDVGFTETAIPGTYWPDADVLNPTQLADPGDFSAGLFHPRFPTFAEATTVARRTSSATRTVAGLYSAVEAAANYAAAVAGLGSWVAETPYDSSVLPASIATTDAYPDGTGGYVYECTVTESKYVVRWAPPASSRAKIVVTEMPGDADTQITWDGATGITLNGIVTCIPHIDSVTESLGGAEDYEWIYDTETAIAHIPITPTAATFEITERYVFLSFYTTRRQVPFP